MVYRSKAIIDFNTDGGNQSGEIYPMYYQMDIDEENIVNDAINFINHYHPDYLFEDLPDYLAEVITRLWYDVKVVGKDLALYTYMETEEPLNQMNLISLQRYLRGQFSDGWGEDLEQQVVATFWNEEDDYNAEASVYPVIRNYEASLPIPISGEQSDTIAKSGNGGPQIMEANNTTTTTTTSSKLSNITEDEWNLLREMWDYVQVVRHRLDTDDIPSYDEAKEYSGSEWTRAEWNKCLRLIENASAHDIEIYNDDESRESYIQLSDYPTLQDIKVDESEADDFDDYYWNVLIPDAQNQFKERTGTDLYLVGRSCRHACVTLSVENALRVDELIEVQQELERWVIEQANQFTVNDDGGDISTNSTVDENINNKNNKGKDGNKTVKLIRNDKLAEAIENSAQQSGNPNVLSGSVGDLVTHTQPVAPYSHVDALNSIRYNLDNARKQVEESEGAKTAREMMEAQNKLQQEREKGNASATSKDKQPLNGKVELSESLFEGMFVDEAMQQNYISRAERDGTADPYDMVMNKLLRLRDENGKRLYTDVEICIPGTSKVVRHPNITAIDYGDMAGFEGIAVRCKKEADLDPAAEVCATMDLETKRVTRSRYANPYALLIKIDENSPDDGKPIRGKSKRSFTSRRVESKGSGTRQGGGKALTEAPIYDLGSQFDSRNSFYGKARVDDDEKGNKILYSYNTPVCRISRSQGTSQDNSQVTLLPKWNASQTTLRHVKEFLKQHGYTADSMKQIQRDYKQGTLGENLTSLKEEYDKDIGSIAKFIESSIKGLQSGEATNYRYRLDDRLAVFVGWSDGYADDDELVIHASENPSYAINVAVKVWTSDDMWTDLDYLNFPYDAESGDVMDMSLSVEPGDDPKALADSILNFYNECEGLVIAKDGRIESKGNGTNESLKESRLNEDGEVAYFSKYKGCTIYIDGEGQFSANTHDSKLGSRTVTGKSEAEVKAKIDGQDEAETKHLDNLPESITQLTESSDELLGGKKGDKGYIVEQGTVFNVFDAEGAYVKEILDKNEAIQYCKDNGFDSVEEVFYVKTADGVFHTVGSNTIYDATNGISEKLHKVTESSHFNTIDEVIRYVKNEYGHYVDEDVLQGAISDMRKAKSPLDALSIWSIYTNLNFYRFKDTDEIVGHMGYQPAKTRSGRDSKTKTVFTRGSRTYKSEREMRTDPTYFDKSLAQPYLSKHIKSVDESLKKQTKPVNEELKLLCGISDYTPWSGATSTWERICDEGKEDDLCAVLEDMYPEGLTMTELNDILWFESEQVFEWLGISDEADEEDEDEDEEEDEFEEDEFYDNHGNWDPIKHEEDD